MYTFDVQDGAWKFLGNTHLTRLNNLVWLDVNATDPADHPVSVLSSADQAVRVRGADAQLGYQFFRWLAAPRAHWPAQRRWQAWISGRIDSALSRGSLFALGLTACLAVYREGAETVLFYEALRISNKGQDSAIAAGLAVGAVALSALYQLIRQASLRLPFHRLFAGTALLLYGLAVVFVGQAVLELQAAGDLPVTPLAGVPHIQWLGLAPTLEGVASQGCLLILPLLLGGNALFRDAQGQPS